jgi:hypothetical protein
MNPEPDRTYLKNRPMTKIQAALLLLEYDDWISWRLAARRAE